MAGSNAPTREKTGGNTNIKTKDIASNRKAYHDYFIEETTEAGLVLRGTEIKAVRDGRVNLKDGYVKIEKGEAWLWNVHISAYDHAGKFFQHEPTRSRKLLLHKDEIRRLAQKIQAKGYTLVPTKLYLKKGLAKVEIGLAKGKHTYDKRDSLAERDAAREIERAIKDRY